MSNQTTVKHDDTLKFIALATMLIDHIGYLLFPQYIVLRLIGRVSFPIFTYLIAKGAKRTTNPMGYALRLLAFGFISQLPYNLFTNHPLWSISNPNIFFTLFAGLLMLLCFKQESVPVKLLGLLVIPLAGPLNLSYSYYGLLLILVFYLFDEKPLFICGGFALASLQYYAQFSSIYQLFAIMVLPIIYFMPPLGIRINKWVGYLFYPVHVLLLVGIYRFWF